MHMRTLRADILPTPHCDFDTQEWLEMIPKPVERRYIWSPASLAPQGKLEMWVEVLTPPQVPSHDEQLPRL